MYGPNCRAYSTEGPFQSPPLMISYAMKQLVRILKIGRKYNINILSTHVFLKDNWVSSKGTADSISQNRVLGTVLGFAFAIVLQILSPLRSFSLE